MKVLDNIRHDFMTMYRHIIGNWSGSSEIFRDFESMIDRLIDDIDNRVSAISVPVMRGRILPLMVRFGEMSKTAYDIACRCDGASTISDIVSSLKVEEKTVNNIIGAFEILGMLYWRDIENIVRPKQRL